MFLAFDFMIMMVCFKKQMAKVAQLCLRDEKYCLPKMLEAMLHLELCFRETKPQNSRS